MTDLLPASRGRLILAFAAVYIVWGSTYLAIRVGVETIPPLLMAGVRFLIAGAILYGFARWRGEATPTRAQWRGSAIVGACLLLLGNGGVVYGEQTVPSGVAALLVAAVPVWMVVLDWLWHGSARPTPRVVVGLVLGLLGIVLLVGPGAFGRAIGGAVDPLGAAVLVTASVSWAVGSVWSRRLELPRNAILATGAEMLCGGTLLTLAGLARGEAAAVHPSAISLASAAALLYLILVGSLIGFTAYIWILAHATPARASTYAYVNPVVAVILGWAILGERLTLRMLLAAAVIVGGVILITTARARAARREGRREEDLAEEAA